VIDPFVVKAISLTTAASSAVVVATAVSTDHVQLVEVVGGGLLGISSLTVAVMMWIDTRMDSKVSKTEKAIRRDIRHLKVLLHEKGVIDYVEDDTGE
jgi:heme O synthase-like polyprenyltransferase